MNHNIQALIFDMASVVTDSETIRIEAEHIALDHCGIRVPKFEWDQCMGKTGKDIFE